MFFFVKMSWVYSSALLKIGQHVIAGLDPAIFWRKDSRVKRGNDIVAGRCLGLGEAAPIATKGQIRYNVLLWKTKKRLTTTR